MTAAPAIQPVKCVQCGVMLAEVADRCALRMTVVDTAGNTHRVKVRGPLRRGIWVECECGHFFRWLGKPAVSPLDIPKQGVQDT